MIGVEEVFGVDFEDSVDLVVFWEVVGIPGDEMDDSLAQNKRISHLHVESSGSTTKTTNNRSVQPQPH